MTNKAANRAIVRQGIKAYKEEILKTVQFNAELFCDFLCEQAIKHRETAPGKHDFTGNLLNSIVVCLYKKNKPVYASYAAERVAKAIQVKMTAPKKYSFKSDYEGAQSYYNPTIKTDEGWGERDAAAFFRSYNPHNNSLFTIVVAYPVEYADWVEAMRATAGILNVYVEANNHGVQYLMLPRA